MKQPEQKKKPSVNLVGIGVTLVVLGLMRAGPHYLSWGAVFLVVIVSGVIVGLQAGKNYRKSHGGEKMPRQRRPEAGNVELGKVFSKLTGADKDPVECEYGEGNHRYSHDEEQRIRQLEGFLKNGIIDREEYQVLLQRYKNSGQ